MTALTLTDSCDHIARLERALVREHRLRDPHRRADGRLDADDCWLCELCEAARADPDRHEGLCDRCGGVNVVWWADHDLWNATGRTDGADEWPFLCPSCFAVVAEQRGVVPAHTVWKMVPSGEVAQRTEPEVSTLQVAGSTPALPATHSLSNECIGGGCSDCDAGSDPE